MAQALSRHFLELPLIKDRIYAYLSIASVEADTLLPYRTGWCPISYLAFHEYLYEYLIKPITSHASYKTRIS